MRLVILLKIHCFCFFLIVFQVYSQSAKSDPELRYSKTQQRKTNKHGPNNVMALLDASESY